MSIIWVESLDITFSFCQYFAFVVRVSCSDECGNPYICSEHLQKLQVFFFNKIEFRTTVLLRNNSLIELDKGYGKYPRQRIENSCHDFYLSLFYTQPCQLVRPSIVTSWYY